MSRVFSKAIGQDLEVNRIIGHIEGKEDGPCLVFFGGIHGNEPSGVFALHQVIDELKDKEIPIRGSVYALSGNIWALERSERFHQTDLNRLWTRENLRKLENDSFQPANEDERQLEELYRIVQGLLISKSGPFYFFDLHTTSCQTIPFITVNDSLLNRQFTRQYPTPIILGIEEYLEGPLLSYLNELGYVSFGFESGQHDDISSIENHVAFTYLSMVIAGSLDKELIDYDTYFETLGKTTGNIFEINYRHEIREGDRFSMLPGFQNFQDVRKGELIAEYNESPFRARKDTKIFMPLYQEQGNDGFFFIKKTPVIYLRISAWLRRWRFDRILPYLPGVSRYDKESDTLMLDLKIAGLMTKPILRLLGYRSQRMDKTHLIVRGREVNAKTEQYIHEHWMA